MMRGLLGYVVAACLVWVIPIASEGLPEDGIQRFLDTPIHNLASCQTCLRLFEFEEALLGPNVPTT